ncbi:hypothetical protein V8Z74_09080 [Comamonas sp. w2-DMI]|uniref:hypothetical protein n=1 Tax=Comamonas sp. w2-DMI TaxID=3126391 RepID=UPI0032E3A9F9
MATITKRGPYQYQAIVRKVGYPSQTETFVSKQEAKNWASKVEVQMTDGTFVDREQAKQMTLGELLERYRDRVTPTKRGKGPELSRMKRLLGHPLAMRRLNRPGFPR